MTKKHLILLRNLIGGAIFVYGTVSLESTLGRPATFDILLMFIGLMVGTGIGFPENWLR